MFMHYCSKSTVVNIIYIILTFLGSREGNIVDLGCGIPFLCRSLDRIFPGFVTGIDLVPGELFLITKRMHKYLLMFLLQ